MKIGVDVVAIARVERMLSERPSMEARLFTATESDYCRARQNPARHFAGTLAAKEAVIKALELGTLARWGRSIEIVRTESGAPLASVTGYEREPLAVSISHDGPVALAVCVSTPARSDEHVRYGRSRGEGARSAMAVCVVPSS